MTKTFLDKSDRQAIFHLQNIATALAERSISGYFIDDENPFVENNHWSGTLAQMKQELRQITPEEIGCLSLSRCYGPVPSVNGELAQELMTYLWPDGNNCGLRMEWADLAERLKSFRLGQQ